MPQDVDAALLEFLDYPAGPGAEDIQPRLAGAPAAAAGPDPMKGRALRGGKYRLLELIGEGGMGAVYEAHDAGLDKPVAIKLLRSDDASAGLRFDREALAMAQVEHTNVLRAVDSGQEADGTVYIVMELLRGEDLRTVLERDGIVPTQRTAALMTQACSGLSAAHGRGIIHRDVKPDNIMIVRGADGRELVKLCDFGLAKLFRRQGRPSKQGRVATSAGMAVGTPHYISPEQARGEDVDPRADIYSCGAVMYEMATGRVPFPAPTPLATLLAHVNQPLQPPREVHVSVDRRLEAIIVKALEKDRRRRHTNALELRAELRALL